MLISPFLPYNSSLFLLVSFFVFVLCRHKSFVNVNITYVAGLSPFLSLSSLSTTIFSHHCHHHGPAKLFYFFPSPAPPSPSSFLSLLYLNPLSPFLSLSHPILNRPNSILAPSLSTLLQSTNHTLSHPSLPSSPFNGIPWREYEKKSY